MSNEKIFALILEVINEVQNTAFSIENVEPDYYLGGELGIDSREMLEIWYEIEKRLSVKVHDYDKRDVYTLKDVIDIFEKQLVVEPAH
ncbi:acyl carrier protein [Aliikangiella sp. IMCC44359]|uniref:acyl carrier protein n=1 Tax=Aliikangiella sp. IMCC44359 TaxID=3459125 RepID=UPI00403AB118